MGDSGTGTPAPEDNEHTAGPGARPRRDKEAREQAEEKADKVSGFFTAMVTGGVFTLLVGWAQIDCRETAKERYNSIIAKPGYETDPWCATLTADGFYVEIMGPAVGILVASVSYFVVYFSLRFYHGLSR